MVSNFKISPRILIHLGEDLIRNESIAILELVKNSYDACASLCLVEFNFENGKLSEIIIEDDGIGMDKEIINNAWLVVGTDNKKDLSNTNVCNRIPLGEKGIGRLGVHKLGKKIDLTSKKENSNEIQLYIDWTKLEGAKKIEDFPIEIKENKTPKYFKNSTGTKIIIKDLKAEWDRRRLREVYRIINSLNSPFENTNDDFKVLVESNSDIFKGLPDFDDIKNAALYFAKCTINNDRIIKFKYEFKPWKSLKRISEGRVKTEKDFDEFELLLSRRKGRKVENFSLENFRIGPIEFEIAIFDNDSRILNYANIEKRFLRNYLKENGGIRVYRDGMRVYDYGEKGNDWLEIDAKRVHKVGGNISNNIIIGAVNLKNRNISSDLKEKTNREGFVENEAYYAFKDAVSFALDLIVRERNKDKEKLTILYKNKKNKTLEPVLSEINEVMEIVDKEIGEEEIKNKILSHLHRINEQYEEVKKVLIKSANAGLNLSVIIHEMEKLIAALVGSVKHKKFEKALELTQQLEKIIEGYSVLIKKSSIKKGKLSDIVKMAFNNYEYRFKDHKVTTISNQSDLMAFYAKNEAVSILMNLLDNSLFWLSYARINNKVISAYVTDRIEGYNSIIVSDNGPGFKIPPEIAVKPFVTGKPNAIGSGLGLHIADELIKAMDGKLLFLNENDIQLPKKVIELKATNAIIALCFPKEK